MSHDPNRCPHCIRAGLTADHWTKAFKPPTQLAGGIRFIDNVFERRASSERGNTCG